MCEAYNSQHDTNFISIIPTNLYGPNDNFDLETSYVLPALTRKFIEAIEEGIDEAVVWGTGKPTRGFLYVEDAAEGILLATEKYNKSEPDGQFQRKLDIPKAKKEFGFEAKMDFRSGLKKTIEWYKKIRNSLNK